MATANYGLPFQGILRLNQITDRILRAAAPEVVIVQPGWYFEMFAGVFKTMQADPPTFETEFSPADHKTGMVFLSIS
jgi:hypothetical protein